MENYFNNIIQTELEEFNKELVNNTKSQIPEFEEVLSYIFSSKGKQLRPALGIMFAKMIGTYNAKQRLFLQSIELIHNATLFHDDVIDDAESRHNVLSLHKKFNNTIAVLTGDYFLSLAIKNIHSLENQNINELFSSYMKDICEGELQQNYSLNKLISIDEYIEKTKKKTALLFELTTLGVMYLSDSLSEDKINCTKNFGLNLGIAFQIKDDLNNFLKYKDKPVLNDLKSGIITAPIIFLACENVEINTLLKTHQYNEIINLLNKSNALNRTKELAQKYITAAGKALATFEDNSYKTYLFKMIESFGY